MESPSEWGTVYVRVLGVRRICCSPGADPYCLLEVADPSGEEAAIVTVIGPNEAKAAALAKESWLLLEVGAWQEGTKSPPRKQTFLKGDSSIILLTGDWLTQPRKVEYVFPLGIGA